MQRNANRRPSHKRTFATPAKTLTGPAIAALLAVQGIVTAAYVVGAESLWIDEFVTVSIARAATLPDWWRQFVNWHGANLQMPLYHGFMAVWTQCFGFSEYALRMANWPMFVAAEGALLWTFRRMPRFAVALLLLSFFHPLIWYYLNEARPYIMVYLGACLTLCALVTLYAETHALPRLGPYRPWLLSVGLLILAGSSLFGAPWVAAAVVVAWHLHVTRAAAANRPRNTPRAAYITLGAGLLLFAGFYVYTLLRVTRPATGLESDLRTLLFSGYELLGLSGLGPGRLELRAAGSAALEGWLVTLFGGALVLGACLWAGLHRLSSILGAHRMGAIAVACALPAATVVAAGFALHWRVLGRHLMPLLPMVLVLLALGTASLWAARRHWARVLAALPLVIMLASGISTGLPRHAKDDYRSAARLTREALAAGGNVWWAASDAGARYYGVAIAGTALRSGADCPHLDPPAQATAYSASNLSLRCLASLPRPDLVVLSKPDIFDRRGALTRWIEAARFEPVLDLPAFRLWRPPAQGHLFIVQSHR